MHNPESIPENENVIGTLDSVIKVLVQGLEEK